MSQDKNKEQVNEDQQKILDEIAKEEGGSQDKNQDDAEKVKEGEEKVDDGGKKEEGEKSDDDDLSNLDEEVNKLVGDDKGKPADVEDEDDDEIDEIGNQPVPLKKHLKQLHNRDSQISQLQKDLADAQAKSLNIDTKAVDEQLQKIADKFGVEKDAVDELFKLAVGATTQQFNERFSKIEPVLSAAHKQKEDAGFESEFQGIADLVKSEHGDKNVTKVKQALYRLAFTKKFANTPLPILYKGMDLFRPKVSGKPAPEGGSAGSRGGTKTIDFSQVTEDDISAMDEKTFDAYSVYLRKRDGQR